MKNFLDNWNYPKHAAAVSGLYLGISLLGNAIFGRKVPEDERSKCPVEVCKQMTKKQWAFNGIVTACYAVDMSVTFLVLRHFKKQYK